MPRLVPLLAVAALAGCSGTPGDVDDARCETHASPSFELGTGEVAFEGALAEEQALGMQRGPQGGCHLPLALRTDGFAGRAFTLRCRIALAETGEELIRSRETRGLTVASDDAARCELLGFRALLAEPWRADGERLAIEVDVEDELGRTARRGVVVRALWPEVPPGVLRDQLCGASPSGR